MWQIELSRVELVNQGDAPRLSHVGPTPWHRVVAGIDEGRVYARCPREPLMRRGSPVSLSTAVFVVAVITAVGVGIRAKVVAQHPKMPFPEVKDLSTVKIKLRRTICFGTCPSYKVEVDGSGLVIFEGYELVAIPGRHSVRVPESSVRALIEAFRQADYFSAEDAYQVTAMDVPTYVTSLAMDGRENQVVDYLGTEAGIPDGLRAMKQFSRRAGKGS